jgi:putative ABC transport system permease protein
MLDRKLLRDLREIASQVIAISLVMAAGVAMFIMALSALVSLSQAKDDYYRRYRFAEVFASAKRVPNSVVPRLEQIPAVSVVYTRIVSMVSIDVPGLDEPALARFISMPDYQQPALNDIYLTQGRMLDPDRANELIISKSFAEAHRLRPTDQLQAIINGKLQRFEIVGVALSPEYIIQIQPGSLLPDHKRFGIFWMSHRQMEAAFDMDGAFNDVSILTEKGANQQAIINQLDLLLERYGCTGAYGRNQQTSHAYITDEIRQLTTMALVAPTIFLGVAAFLLNVVIARLVGLQREQIAALKAFGYHNLSVGLHYLKLVVIIALLGSACGIVMGFFMARMMTRMYAEFYEFPSFGVTMPGGVVVGAVSLSLLASILGVFNSIRRAIRLPPAQAMRPEPPANYRATLVERLGIGRFLPQAARMILRQIERRPMKSLTTIIGIGMSVSILMLGTFSLDAIRYIMNFQFRIAQRQQLSISLIEPTTDPVVHEIGRLNGVNRIESFRSVSAKLGNGHRWKRVGILGLDHGNELFRLLDVHERPVELPDSGIILNDKLAELLHVEIGDTVCVSVLEGNRPQVFLLVTRIIREYGGVNAYMNRFALHRLMNESSRISGAFLDVEHGAQQQLFRTLKRTPRIGSVSIKHAALQSFEETVAENILMMRTFNIFFAVLIAVGVVYNSARISLSEQSRELATLRVIGFTRYEVSSILLGELGLLTLVAIPVGWLIGFGLVASFVLAMDTEMYRIPLVINRSTYLFAAVTVILAAIGSGWVVQQRIRKLDMIGVLKTKE